MKFVADFYTWIGRTLGAYMFSVGEDFRRALIFSGAAMLFVVASAWWLYLSKVKTPIGNLSRPSPRLAVWLVGLLGFSMILLVTGALWDASKHIQTGEVPAGADFLWPPHIMIYGSFMLSFIVAGISLGLVARPEIRAGRRDPRLWVRGNPFLGAVALASIYAIFTIPGDAIWHALYGIDLTAWSPPHVLLGVASCAVLISALGLLRSSRPAGERSAWYGMTTIGLLTMVLSFGYLLAVIEWELPGAGNPHVLARPIWEYPVAVAVAAFIPLALAARLTSFRWAATATALAFYALRLLTMAGLSLTGNVVPYLPLWFLLGAVFMDLIRLPQVKLPARWRGLAEAAAFSMGYAALALPLLTLRPDLRAFTGTDRLLAVVITFALCAALEPLVEVAARRLGRPGDAHTLGAPAL